MAPELFEVVVATKDGYEHLPKPEVPYYVKAFEGNYIHRNTQIGDVLLPVPYNEFPALGRIGYAKGVFDWNCDHVPARIISQAHDFFKRTYERLHAEAEVLITMHNETKEFRLFVPFQRVSHAGVKSIFEPTHIDRNYTVVGTLHSHCDFSAFHSGTDSGDASDMDGVHFTIGHVNSETPEIVAMVAMSGKEFHYKDPKDIADIEWGVETAPAWWDQYILTNPPETKPASLISLTQAEWNEFLGRALHKPKPTQSAIQRWTPPQNRPSGWVSPYRQSPPAPLPDKGYHAPQRHLPDNWDWRAEVYGGAQSVRESVDFNRRQIQDKATGVTWGPDGELLTGIPELDVINKALAVAEASLIFSDADWDDINAKDMDDIAYWQKYFLEKASKAADVLEILGLDLNFQLAKGKAK